MILSNDRIAAIADLIIPAGPNGEPSASQSRAVSFIIDYLDTNKESAQQLCSLLEGLAREPSLDEPLLKQKELREPSSFQGLVELIYTAYYGDPAIVEELGLPGPPQPRGYHIEPFDGKLLEPVRFAKKESK